MSHLVKEFVKSSILNLWKKKGLTKEITQSPTLDDANNAIKCQHRNILEVATNIHNLIY